MEEFYTILEPVSSQIIEKKSKFIANVFHISTKNDAEEIIKQVKKKYHDARHNVIAYRVYEENAIVEKFSDDGEPSGTAGAPILDILKQHNLCNILVIVTRYFGGILLGTGGLVKAYSESTLKAIESSEKIHQCKGLETEVKLDYKTVETFKHYCKKNKINIVNIEYSDFIVCKIELENKIKDKLIKDIDTKKINIKEIKNFCKKIINKSVEK